MEDDHSVSPPSGAAGDHDGSPGHPFRRLVLTALFAATGLALAAIPWPGPSRAGRTTLGVFLFAVLSWITETLPPWVTGGVVVAGLAAFVPPTTSALSHRDVLAAFASPVVILFAGGFILAAAMQRHGLDRAFARLLLRRVRRSRRALMAAVMAATAFLSMWMSNTAATALMVAMVLPMVRSFRNERLARAFLLAVPFAANLGGMATPVGTPPNAIAMGALAAAGHPVTFLQWTVVGLPAAVLLLALTYLVLTVAFGVAGPIPEATLQEHAGPDGPPSMTRTQWAVAATGGVTVLLWLTSSLHHVPSAVCALLPPAVFFTTGILDREDLRRIGWDVLVLMAGGIALGLAMKRTGLTTWFVGLVGPHRLGAAGLVVFFGASALLLSNFMSNTSTASVLVPLALSAALPAGPMAVALMASAAMSLPVSTPPNAIAHGTGLVATKDMAKYGALVGLAALVTNLALLYLLVGL